MFSLSSTTTNPDDVDEDDDVAAIAPPVVHFSAAAASTGDSCSWGAIHQLLSIILKSRILFLLPVSTLPYVVKVKNDSQIGESILNCILNGRLLPKNGCLSLRIDS
jgi:hypothetical protein